MHTRERGSPRGADRTLGVEEHQQERVQAPVREEERSSLTAVLWCQKRVLRSSEHLAMAGNECNMDSVLMSFILFLFF